MLATGRAGKVKQGAYRIRRASQCRVCLRVRAARWADRDRACGDRRRAAVLAWRASDFRDAAL